MNQIDQINIAASFTIDPIIKPLQYLQQKLDLPFQSELAAYNQVFQEILQANSRFAQNPRGLNVLVIRLEDWVVSPSKEPMPDAHKLDKAKQKKLAKVVDDFTEAMVSFQGRALCATLLVIAPSNNFAESQRFIETLKIKLIDSVSTLPGLTIIDAKKWEKHYNINDKFDEIRNELGHIPFLPSYFAFLATLIVRRYYRIRHSEYKVLVVDCDNTLWSGVCGEQGAKGVKIEKNHKAFQEFLIKKYEQGMLICLCSKNSESDVWQVFDEHPHMILNRNHIVEAKINWLPKSQNIQDLANKLNLGLDSFVFIDDNPVECAEVNANCPQVFVIQWPDQEVAQKNLINHCWVLDTYSFTQEDKKRTTLYKANIARDDLKAQSVNFEDFLKNLEMTIEIKEMDPTHLPRVAQLTQRTNQFNFTTIRRTEAEIQQFLADDAHHCLTVEVADRFGSYGLVGLVLYEVSADRLELDSFLLSCRVLGRGVEHAIMARIGDIAREKQWVAVHYRPSAKNEPALRFFLELSPGYLLKATDDEQIAQIPPGFLKVLTYNPQSAIPQESVESGLLEKVETDQVQSLRDQEHLLTLIMQELSDLASLTPRLNVPEIDQGTPSNSKDFEAILNEVIACFAAELELSPAALGPQVSLESLHIESMQIVEITARLAKKFARVPPTLIFEQTSLGGVAEFLTQCQTGQGDSGSELAQADATKNPPITPTDSQRITASSDIAIIGMACKYPKADDYHEFWQNLVAGKSCISEVQAERWGQNDFFNDQDRNQDQSYSKWCGLIDDHDKFDAGFFGISPREAATMDPQQRLFLQTVWSAFEDAGYSSQAIEKNTGVYVGVISSDYGIIANQAVLEGNCSYRNSEYYQIPNRVSYFFNFNGPSLAIDSACSASASALHLACQSLKSGECKQAVVGGVNLFLGAGRYIQYSNMQMLSHGERCKPFGADADGTVFGEGIGAVILKPLAAAERDGDRIYGLIKGTALNSGGKTNGFTVPNPAAQAETIQMALADGGIDPRTISYIEAHGTGTSLGDPIEIRGLTMAFSQNLSGTKPIDNQYCSIGSVKSNIGHLESGAAIAGLIKVLLQMQHQTLVPSLNAEKNNPLIEFSQTPFKVQSDKTTWQRPIMDIAGQNQVIPRRAGISSFGAGGSNSHIIVEEYLPPVVAGKAGPDTPTVVIVLSAKKMDSLGQQAERLRSFILSKQLTDQNIADLAYTLQVGRDAMEFRLGFVAASMAEVVEILAGFPQSNDARVFQAEIKQKGGALETYQADQTLQMQLEQWIATKNFVPLIQAWVKGLELDWNLLHCQHRPQRIALPSYSFRLERHWLKSSHSQATTKSSQESVLRPLLQRNISGFDGLGFESEFDSAAAQTPALTLLAMTMAALRVLVGKDANTTAIKMEHIAWTDEKTLGENFGGTVKLRFSRDGKGAVLFESSHKNPDHPVILHQGYADPVCDAVAPRVDRADPDRANRVFSSAEIQEMGAAQSNQNIQIGQMSLNGGLLVFQVDGTGYTPVTPLDPFMLQAALQGTLFYLVGMGYSEVDFHFNPGGFQNLALVEWYQPFETQIWVQVRLEQHDADRQIALFAIDISNEAGKVILHLGGLEYCLTATDMAADLSSPLLQVKDRPSEPERASPTQDPAPYQMIGVESIRDYLQASLAESLYVATSEIDIDKKFIDLGLDSIIAVEWIKLVNKRFAAKILATKVYDYPSVRQLTEYVAKELHKNVAPARIMPFVHQPAPRDPNPGKPVGISLAEPVAFADSRQQSPKPRISLTTPGVHPIAGISPVSLPTKPELAQSVAGSSTPNAINEAALRDYLVESLADALYIPKNDVDANKKFIDIGLDSIIAVEWIKTLNKKYQLNISATRVYDYPTIQQFATHLIGVIQTQSGPAHSIALAQPDISPHAPVSLEAVPAPKEPAISGFLMESLAEALYVEQSTINPDMKFVDMGLDSIIAVEWIKVVNKKYQTNVSAPKVYDNPTIKEFARYLSAELSGSRSAAALTMTVSRSVPEMRVERSVAGGRRILISILEVQNPANSPVHSEQLALSPPRVGAEDIAIVGISARLPGAADLDHYWELLRNGQSAVREIGPDRWDNAVYYDANPEAMGKTACKWMGMVDDADKFDPLFFNISPKEATIMDPQVRLFIQEGFKAFEDAGYGPKGLDGQNCGIYLGLMSHDYHDLFVDHPDVITNTTGHSFAIAAARLAYFLNLRGPAVPVDTACSSSLVATHLAFQALRNHDIDMALVGGSTLYLDPRSYIAMSATGMLSPTGTCRTFDNAANGFVPGEGAAALVLKRLKDAERDQDHIYGIIRGIGTNQDGTTNGITAPSLTRQLELEREVYQKSGVNPDSISYAEMHGTGTRLGDPIELEALASAFQENTNRKQFCAIGSVKSNIGHTSAAAGLAGIIKVLLCMKHRTLVPSLNFQQANELFEFTNSPFYVNTQAKSWDVADSLPRRATVSSFGFSGTNAHLVLEEYIPPTRTGNDAIKALSPVICVLSARSQEQLKIYADRLRNQLEQSSDYCLPDLAYTLQTGRIALSYRLAIVVDSQRDLQDHLADFAAGRPSSRILTGVVKSASGKFALGEGEDLSQQQLGDWIKQGKLSQVAQLWLQGHEMDWNLLYGAKRPGKLSLPSYPFAKTRYWLSHPKSPAIVPPTVPTAAVAGALTTQPWSVAEGDSSNGANGSGKPRVSLNSLAPSVPIEPSVAAKAEIPKMAAAQIQTAFQSSEPEPSLLEIHRELRTMLSEILYLDDKDVDLDSSFIELGMDSISGVEWIRKVNKRYQTKIVATAIYDYPNLRLFAAYLSQEGKLAFAHSGPVAVKNPSMPAAAGGTSKVPIPHNQDLPGPDLFQVQAELKRMLAEVLFLEAAIFDLDSPFIELGMDSISGVEWVRKVNTSFATKILATSIYDYPNLREFAAFLVPQLGPSRVSTTINQPVPVPSTARSTDALESMDAILEKLYQGGMDIEEALKKLL